MKLLFLLAVIYLVLITTAIAQPESKDRIYEHVSYTGLAHMVWRFQTYETNNDEVLDDFLRITKCGLYDKYYKDDFLWGNIRESARREIDYYAHQFPNRFEIITAIPLGRYNFDRAAFTIADSYKMNNVGAIDITPDKDDTLCGISPFIPSIMNFSAENSYHLFEIPVPVHKAEQLLDKIKKYKYSGIRVNNNRALTARFRISINDVRMRWNNDRDKRIGIVFKGQLDEIAFFADPDMTDLVWRKPFVELGSELTK